MGALPVASFKRGLYDLNPAPAEPSSSKGKTPDSQSGNRGFNSP